MTSSAVLLSPRCPSVKRSCHVLTITPFFPSHANPVAGCFIAEALPYLRGFGVKETTLVAHPFYREGQQSHPHFPAEWIRFFSFPRGFGLASAGAFLHRRLLERVRTLHRENPIDLI